MKVITQKLESILAQTKYTQADLAQITGTSDASVSRWMRGAKPRTKHLQKIAAAVKIDISTLTDDFAELPPLLERTPPAAESPTPTVAISETLSEEINKAAAKLEMNRQDTVRLLLKTGLKCLEYIDYNIAEQIALPAKKGGQ